MAQDGHEVIILSRSPEMVINLPNGATAAWWDGKTAGGWGDLVSGADVIVNLAAENLKGKGLFPRRWTPARKERIRQSRLDAGRAIVQAIQQSKHKQNLLLVQASAAGYYGPHGEETVTEQTPPGNDFLAQLCQDWEASTAAVEKLNTRRVLLRTGLPLTLKGGAFPSLVLPFRMFVGNTFGTGKQYYPWIHFDDCIRAIRFLIDDPNASGPYNISAPNPVTNREFARTLGKVVHRPWFFPIPRFALELAFGEVAAVVMDGQRVLPNKLTMAGFQFSFPVLQSALEDLFVNKDR